MIRSVTEYLVKKKKLYQRNMSVSFFAFLICLFTFFVFLWSTREPNIPAYICFAIVILGSLAVVIYFAVKTSQIKKRLQHDSFDY